MTYDFAIVSSLGLSRAGVAGELDELQHGAVRVVEIGARAVDDTALAVLLEGDRDHWIFPVVTRPEIASSLRFPQPRLLSDRHYERREAIPSRLKADVGWWQAEFGAAEHGGGTLRVVAGMGAHCVHIAPGALD